MKATPLRQEEHESDSPELVEILQKLAAHRRAEYERTYGNPPWTHEQADAWWYHPLARACDWLEDRLGISRHELELAAIRLTTPQGLKGMDPLTGPDGRTTNPGQPDLLWMIPKFRELDRDGTTARLWKLLVEKYPAILANAGFEDTNVPRVDNPAAEQQPDEPADDASLADPSGDSPSKIEVAAIALAGGDYEAVAAVAAVASDGKLDLENKLLRIASIHPPATAWKSPKWAELLEVTDGRIRQLATWNKWRETDKRE